MSAFHDRQNEAQAGYVGDYCRELPVIVPLCEADAEARRQSIAAEHRARVERISGKVLDERAAARRASTTNHARNFQDHMRRFHYLMADARKDGFSTPHADEIAELARRTMDSLREQQEACQ